MADIDRGAFKRYLSDIGRLPMMTPSEEIEMGRLVKRGRDLEALERDLTPVERREVRKGIRAQQRFVEANMRLVVYVAKKYASKTYHLDICDLMQEGALGLARAAMLFDHERGYKFSTYSYWWIRQGITRGMNNLDRLIRRPVAVAEAAAKLPRIYHTLSTRLDRVPTKEEVAAEAGISHEELDLIYQRGGRLASLDMLIGEDESSSLIQHIKDPNAMLLEEREDLIEAETQWEKIELCMKQLSQAEQICVRDRYGLYGNEVRTLHAIGDDLGLSREGVRQKVILATQKMRKALRSGGTRITVVPPVKAAVNAETQGHEAPSRFQEQVAA